MLYIMQLHKKGGALLKQVAHPTKFNVMFYSMQLREGGGTTVTGGPPQRN